MKRHATRLRVAKRCLRAALLAVLLAPAWPHSALAATVATYTFTGDSLASSDTNPDSTASDITIGAGLSGKTTFFTLFGSTRCLGTTSNNTPATEAASVSAGDYISLTVTPNGGGSLLYTSFIFNFAWQNFSNTILESLSIRSSVDSFASTLDSKSQSETVGTSGLAGGLLSLASLPAQSAPVEFRIYFFDDQDSSFSTVGITSISLLATVVPEPSSAALLLAGVLLIARRKR